VPYLPIFRRHYTNTGLVILCAVVDVGWSRDVGRQLNSLPTARDQPTSTRAHNNHHTCVRVVSPEDGQVMRETCRDFEP
jgi:hypothetical protein